MNTSAVIQYRATSIADLVDAVKAIRSLGISPDVKMAPPAVTIPPPEVNGPQVKAYLDKTGESHFRRNKDEFARGISVEQAAEERNGQAAFPDRKPLAPEAVLSDEETL